MSEYDLDEVTEPSEAEVIFAAVKRGLRGVHTSCPGKVKSYDPVTQTASIELAIELESTPGNFERVPPLLDVPIAWPQSATHYLHLPLVTGDGVTVHFYEQDPSLWFARNTISTPPIQRRHGLFPVAIPGPATIAQRLTPAEAPAGKAVLGARGGAAAVAVGTVEVQLGDLSATVPVVLATPLATALSAACDAAVLAASPTDGGAAAFGAFKVSLAAATASYSATKVKGV